MDELKTSCFFPSPNWWIRALVYTWAVPNSIIGILIGSLGLITGGRWQLQRGCLEFYGGLVTWILKRMAGNGVMAMTLGHTILGQTESGLDWVRDHEQVHVRQYERWGPLFIPVYLFSSAYLWMIRKDAYRDNPFEVEAFSLSDPSLTPPPRDDP